MGIKLNMKLPAARSDRARLSSRSDRGTVLMEAIIAIPLLLLLIGGILWIGQLIYDRQKLVIADRYVAWNSGNRHGATWGDVQQQFFSPSSYDTSSVRHWPLAQTNWWHFMHGEVSLVAQMPPWTRGPLAAFDNMRGQPLQLPEKTPPYYGRLNLSGLSAGGHAVVMRRAEYPGDTRDYPGDPRNNIPPIPPLGMNSDTVGINDVWLTGESYHP